tara:strand:- start:18220 stop:18360 length:141 start_codon:yes stop_codon:yes gene_type:complete
MQRWPQQNCILQRSDVSIRNIFLYPTHCRLVEVHNKNLALHIAANL